jgi:hypothetical protein
MTPRSAAIRRLSEICSNAVKAEREHVANPSATTPSDSKAALNCKRSDQFREMDRLYLAERNRRSVSTRDPSIIAMQTIGNTQITRP